MARHFGAPVKGFTPKASRYHCLKLSAEKRDDRIQIDELPDGKDDGYEFRACYVKYLLPMRLDIQALKWEQGREPKRWRYGP